MWFSGTPEIDKEIRLQFEDIYHEELSHFSIENQKDAEDFLSLIILFDQFPRNMFRYSPKAYEADAKARLLCQVGLEQDLDQKLPKFMRPFFYMPLEHSENLEDQIVSVSLFKKLGDPSYLQYAIDHYKVIQEFGRFPYRNQILGRKNTPEEVDFLKNRDNP